jgi:hypothetical protein
MKVQTFHPTREQTRERDAAERAQTGGGCIPLAVLAERALRTNVWRLRSMAADPHIAQATC